MGHILEERMGAARDSLWRAVKAGRRHPRSGLARLVSNARAADEHLAQCLGWLRLADKARS